MISIIAAILERLRRSPRIITPAVATANGTGINVCKAAVDVTLPRGWCQPAQAAPVARPCRELDATTSRMRLKTFN
jgi:hypothetical protein